MVVNADAFEPADYLKAGYSSNPLTDGSLKDYRLVPVPMTTLNRQACAKVKLSPREADRCKNFFALGLVYWLYERPLDATLNWIAAKFTGNVAIRDANSRALKAGYHFGETTETMPAHFRVPKAAIPPGRYRKITGNEAVALGLVAAAQLIQVAVVLRRLSQHAGRRHHAPSGGTEAFSHSHFSGGG